MKYALILLGLLLTLAAVSRFGEYALCRYEDRVRLHFFDAGTHAYCWRTHVTFPF